MAVEELFKGRHFGQEVMVLCVRWYLRYKLSYRDLVAMMGERGILMAHTTILRCWAYRRLLERLANRLTKITSEAPKFNHE